MTKNPVPCRPDCPRRAPLCHGKLPDGSWICPDWARYQDSEAQRRAEEAKRRSETRMMTEYSYKKRSRWTK